jgi:hypothetical protein
MSSNILLTEGGNVFKDPEGNIKTQRIQLADIAPTIKWLENLTGLPLSVNMLGSTGQKPSSGDLDLAVDINKVSKEELDKTLTDWLVKSGVAPEDVHKKPNGWVIKTGINVHFLTPIAGNPKNGYVQTDFMFLRKPDWSKFILTQDPNSEYKGASRNVLLNSMAKSMGLKLNQNDGIMSREDNRLISDDPDVVAELLLGKPYTAQDLMSVEKIMKALQSNGNRDALIADWLAHMERQGTPYQGEVNEDNEVSLMARLRDRIINQGMSVITENPYNLYVLKEGARIAHPEDLIFDLGAAGANDAMRQLQATSDSPTSATVKWDGKPAIIFGRDETGQFILTDKSAFVATKYDGIAKSPKQLAQIMNMRKGDRTDLNKMYASIWPKVEASLPQNFRGFVMADLLYSNTPPLKNGNYIFKPNTVTYSVNANSELGKRIADSSVGLAVHTYKKGPGDSGSPIQSLDINPGTGVTIFGSKDEGIQSAKLNSALYKQTAGMIKQHTSGINTLFAPENLRSNKISNLPELMKQYVNHRVRSGGFKNLLTDFAPWVRAKAPTKSERILKWANENEAAFVAVFEIFLKITQLKNDLVAQFDKQTKDVQASYDTGDRGHEGYVANDLKFVDRFKFSRANFAQNNPDLT